MLYEVITGVFIDNCYRNMSVSLTFSKAWIMSSEMLVLFFIVAIVLVGGAIVFSSLVAPRSLNPAKFEPYECGIPTEGPAWIQFNVGFV